MIIYIIFYCIIIVGAVLSFTNLNKKAIKMIFAFISVLFFVLIGFRYSGYDYTSYLSIFEDVKDGNEVFAIEPGFIGLCYISSTFRILLLIVSLLTIVIQSLFLYKTSDLPIFSLFLLSATFLLPTFMGQIRQGIAIGFVAFALYYYNNKKYYLYILFALIATLFHFSALVAVIFIFVPRTVKNFNYYFVTILISIFAYQFFQPILFKIINSIPNFETVDKLLFYSENDDVKLGFNTAILIRIFVLSLCYYYKEEIKSEFFPIMMNIYHLSIVIYLVIGPIIPQLGGRGTLYFAYFDVILIPFIIKASSNFKHQLIITVFFLLTLLRIFQFFHDDFNYECYVPYFKYINL